MLVHTKNMYIKKKKKKRTETSLHLRRWSEYGSLLGPFVQIYKLNHTQNTLNYLYDFYFKMSKKIQ